jgi:hypothetical protein
MFPGPYDIRMGFEMWSSAMIEILTALFQILAILQLGS